MFGLCTRALIPSLVVLATTALPGLASGPKLVWIDLDQDGLEDLLQYVPGGSAHLLLNAGDGTFDVADGSLDALPSPLLDALRFDMEGRGEALALATAERTFLVEISEPAPRVVKVLPGSSSLEARDFDDDGRMDLVLGGHIHRQLSGGTFQQVSLPIADVDPPPTTVGDSGLAATTPSTDPEAAQGVAGDLAVSGVLHTHGTGDNTFAGDVAIGTDVARQDLSIGDYLDIYSGWWSGATTEASIRASPSGNLILNGNEDGDVYINYESGVDVYLLGDGNVGVGTSNPNADLDVAGTAAADTIRAGSNLEIFSGAGPAPGQVSGSSIRASSAGNLVLNAEDGGSVYINYDSGQDLIVGGRATVDVLTVRGGADITEPFRAKAGTWEPGHVMVIDPDDPGAIKRSSHAYDSMVAGVVSGAGGIRAGVSLQQDGRLEGDVPLALSGRVYVWADASAGAVRPGDLLTTSDVPGHAMTVSNPGLATGAILGKALTGLESGRGLVLTLVALQ